MAALLLITLSMSACLLQLASTEHNDWETEVAILKSQKGRLPLQVVCVKKTSTLPDALLGAVKDILADAPFDVRDTTRHGPDLVAKVHAAQLTSVKPLAYFCILTLLIIPGNVVYELELEIDFVDRDDKVAKSYRRKGHYTTWLGWIFFLYGPAVSDMNAGTTVIEDMARDIVKEIYDKDYEFFVRRGSR